TARWTQPIAAKIEARRGGGGGGDKAVGVSGAEAEPVAKSAPERRLGSHDDLTPEPAGEKHE
ncbi:cation:proton antiporter, partial [Streptomyces sp. SID7982]|nr:cation:proton antiporter [Streptomyces sp. SID7982]